jgi:hypothetical protein
MTLGNLIHNHNLNLKHANTFDYVSINI